VRDFEKILEEGNRTARQSSFCRAKGPLVQIKIACHLDRNCSIGTSNETVMLCVLIFIGLAITLVGMTATTRKPQRMTEEMITRGWFRDALDKALSEDKAKPSPVQRFAFNVKHDKPETDKAA
jgi:hypothetical protein